MTKITKNISLVIDELIKGNPVALPTETVYGLAANALNKDAVLNIFKIKKRPHFDPLIVHIKNISEIYKYAKYIPEDVFKLADKFSPGPITYVINKKNNIHDLVTAGLKTVAIRIPSHPLIINVLKNIPFPLAAPSANMFGRISPTSAKDVLKELNGKINYVLEGGKSKIGIESTVLGFENNEVFILRPGFITKSQIENILGKKVQHKIFKTKINSPGLLSSHYAPHTPLYIAEGNIDFDILKNRKAGFLDISKFKNINSLASNLFSELRKMDEKKYTFLVVEKIVNEGLGFAVNDRLQKASSGFIKMLNNELVIVKK